jgi:hypothetical protein
MPPFQPMQRTNYGRLIKIFNLRSTTTIPSPTSNIQHPNANPPSAPMPKRPAAAEPFPALSATSSRDSANPAAKPRRRPDDSALRGDPPGDTSAPALATMYDQSSTGSSPAATPVRPSTLPCPWTE